MTLMRMKSLSKKHSRIAALPVDALSATTKWTKEPELIFGGGNRGVDPKVGIPLYGPRSLGTARHPKEVHIGFIGPAESVERVQEFYSKSSEGVPGGDRYFPFPGFTSQSGFRSELRLDSAVVEKLTRQEILSVEQTRKRRDRFDLLLGLLDDKVRHLSGKDHPLDVVVVVLPPELHHLCRVADYREIGVGRIHRDLRRAFKANVMKYQKPTQIFLESTTGSVETSRKLDDPATIAWNLFTGLYFKSDGLPWSPHGLAPNSCYVGISFYRPLGQESVLQTSVAQAFDENGEGLVLRGHSFEWNDDEQGRSPHLTGVLAEELIKSVLAKYSYERNGRVPDRVVVHKSSRFEDEEREGFESALRSVREHDLVAVCPTNSIRLIRAGQYPPLRGTMFTFGDTTFLYTNGYLVDRQEYPHGHVPSPLQISDHVGDSSLRQLADEILLLSKMNWNSANFSGLLPITLRFSRLVSEILKEFPDGSADPSPKYKYYM